MSGYVPRQPPPPRSGLIALIVLSSLALIAAAVCGVLIIRTNSGSQAVVPTGRESPAPAEPSDAGPSAPGDPSGPPAEPSPAGPPSTPATPTKTYAKIEDTGGPARGQAEALSKLLRARGLSCSDENLAKVFSRTCSWSGLGTSSVRVEFIGPVDGTLGEVSVTVDHGYGFDEPPFPDVTFEALVEDFIASAGLDSTDATTVRKRWAEENAEFDVTWGEVKLDRGHQGDGDIRFWRSGWDQPKVTGATLPGDLRLVESAATGLGYRCSREEFSLECVRSQGGTLELSAGRAVPKGLDQLHVTADTGREDGATELALADLSAVLDVLGGARAAAAKQWFTQNRGAAGGIAYAGGMQARFTLIEREESHWAQLGLRTPCRGPRGSFC